MPESFPIETEIVVALRRIIRAIDLHSRQLVQEIGLTWPQLATLRAADRAGSISIGALARLVHLGQPTLTGIVDRLERNGFLQRLPNEEDGRSVRVVVTDSGRDLLSRSPSLLQDRFTAQLARLRDWERHQMLGSLLRIAEMMDADALDASPLLVSGIIIGPPGDEPAPAADLQTRGSNS